MIDSATIDRIFAAADIVEVIGDFVHLKRAGANYKGMSPFTNEKTPSFMVSPAKGIYKCFSSGKGGNAVSFIMEHEKLTYPEALRYLAKKYNIEIVDEQQSPEQLQKRNDRESMLAVNEFAARQFAEWLKKSQQGTAIGLSYLKERGFRDNTIDQFQLGYSLDSRDAFTQLAQQNGYKLDYLVKTGLTVDKGTYQFDRFSGRVIFPIHSISGQVIGFGGRILKKDDKAAKYLNSPESEVYHKSNVLYGLYQAKNSVIKHDKCFLVEGYTDVTSLHQAGIDNVVASSGTALTAEQVRLIKRFTKNITVLYDGDQAGIKASLRGIDIILEEGLNVKVLLLPDGEDPDSFSRSHSITDLTQYIQNNETDFIKFKTRLLAKDAADDPVQRANLINDVVKSISVIPDTIVRAVYIRECSKILEMDEKLLYSESDKLRHNKLTTQVKKENYPHQAALEPEYIPPPFEEEMYPPLPLLIPPGNHFPHERDLIQALLRFGNQELRLEDQNNPSVAEYIVREILADELDFQHPVYRSIFSITAGLVENGQEFNVRTFTQHQDPDICTATVDLTTDNYELSVIWTKHESRIASDDMRLREIIPELVIAFKNKKVIDLIKQTQEEIVVAQQNGDSEAITMLSQKFMVLNELKKHFAKELGDRIIYGR